MNKIYESDRYVVYRGIDKLTLYSMEKLIIKEEKMVFLYASRGEFMLNKYEFPPSEYLALYETVPEISNESIIESVEKLGNNIDNTYVNISGPKRGIISGK